MARLAKLADEEISALTASLDDKVFDLHDMGRRASDKGIERSATDREMTALLQYLAALSSLVATLSSHRAMEEHIRDTEIRLRADLTTN